MKLFAFGLGYCALDFIARFGELFESSAGTVRDADKAAALAGDRIETFVFGPGRNLNEVRVVPQVLSLSEIYSVLRLVGKTLTPVELEFHSGI